MKIHSLTFCGALAASLLAGSAANATLVISAAPTSGVACKGGTCTETQPRAYLNAGDLAAMLAGGDVIVKSGSQAKDIAVEASLSWASAHQLRLDSYRHVEIRQPIAVEGSGASLVLLLGDGAGQGDLVFTGKGRFLFRDLSDLFGINGDAYTLLGDIDTLVADMAANPSGNYALANDCDAGKARRYHDAPVATFSGRFEGLGNAIRHLKIYHLAHDSQSYRLGLIGLNEGVIDGLTLTDLQIQSSAQDTTGGIAGENSGDISHVKVSGRIAGDTSEFVGMVTGQNLGNITDTSSAGTIAMDGTSEGNSEVGGLVGFTQEGGIASSRSSVSLQVGTGWIAGGLVGGNEGSVTGSYATGVVNTGNQGFAGGLIGINFSDTVQNSYATGFTLGGVFSTVGGFVGRNTESGHISTSYSTGAVSSGSGDDVGGFVGQDAATLTNDYFDIDTSGQSHGDGTNTGDSGITGLTTQEFLAGLPGGFDPALWAQAPGINGGYPYLRQLVPH